jgi:hypothetical protein
MQELFGTAIPSAGSLCLLLAFPVPVRGADEFRRRRTPDEPAVSGKLVES